ncbi:MAG TPA: phosphatase PAP2 family protein [Terracidiphilus sp.]|nr:phosphatase PAP2 family protein [Terracidiphilus sp.]
MRGSEWIQTGFVAGLAVASFVCPLSGRRRKTILLLAAVSIVLVGVAAGLALIFPQSTVSIVRDWLPVPLMLIPYWQAGQFFRGPSEKKQAWLMASDRPLFQLAARMGLKAALPLRLSLEWAYSLCYGMAAAGLGVLYASGMRLHANQFWVLVLTPTYLCYVITPFVPALPPRTINNTSNHGNPSNAGRTKSRVFNLWILEYLSIQAISFPSAHVASALAVSLVLLHFVPAAGWVFIVVTFWIAVAAVVGRYHYAVDVVMGALLAAIVYAALAPHLMPRTLLHAAASIFFARP